MDLNTYVSAALIFDGGRILVSRRTNGYWEFPGGKVETGEHPRDTVRRELKEELGLTVEAGPVFDILFYSYPQRHVVMPLYLCRLPFEQEPQLLDGPTDAKWIRFEDLEPDAFLPADRVLLTRFREQPGKTAQLLSHMWESWFGENIHG